MLKLDRFTLIVIGVVVALIVAAIITVNRTSGSQSQAAYLTEDSPAAAVYNAF